MGSSLRWIGVAFALGLCAAYALWGGPQPGAAATGPKIPPGTNLTPPPEPDVEALTGMGDQASPLPPAAPGAKSNLRCTPFTLDYGEVKLEDSKTQIVKVANTGGKPVKIIDLHPSCGCVTGNMPNKIIKPGESEALTVVFTAKPGRRLGRFSITMATDEDGTPRVTVPIEARIIQEFEIEPLMLKFGRIAKRETKTLTATVRNSNGTPFKILEARSSNKVFTFKWEEIAGSNGTGYNVSVTASGLFAGRFNDGAALVVDHKIVPMVALPVTLEIAPDIACVPLNVRAAQRDDKTVEPFEVTVTRSTPGKLIVESVTEGAKLPVEFSAEQFGDASVKLTIRFTEPYPNRVPVGQFLIKTNAEEEATALPYMVKILMPKKESAPALPGK